MISVEQVIQELRRIQGEIPSCAARCGQYRGNAEIAEDNLDVFEGEAGVASSCLIGAARSLIQAQIALEELNSRISTAILDLSK